MKKEISEIEVLRFRSRRFVLYASGDYGSYIGGYAYRGTHGRVIGSPLFDSVSAALVWAKSNPIKIAGHKFGQECDRCWDRLAASFGIGDVLAGIDSCALIDEIRKQEKEHEPCLSVQ